MKYQPEGDMAMGRAVESAGRAVMDVARAYDNVVVAEENSRAKRAWTDFENKETELRRSLEEQRATEGLSAQQVEDRYKEEVSKLHDDISESLEFRTSVGEQFKEMFTQLRTRSYQDYQSKDLYKYRAQDTKANVLSFLDNLNLQAANSEYEDLRELGHRAEELFQSPEAMALYGPDGIHQLRQKARDDMYQSFIMSQVEKKPEQMKEYLNSEGDLDMFEGMNPLLREQMKTKADARLAEIERDEEEQIRATQEAHYYDAELALEAGQIDIPDVLDMYESAKIDRRQRNSLIDKARAHKAAVKEKGDLLWRYTNHLGTKTPMNPDNPEDRKAVNLAYEQRNADHDRNNVPIERRKEILLDEIATIGIVPDDYRNSVQTNMRSEDEEISAQGIAEMGALMAANSNIASQFEEDEVLAGLMFNLHMPASRIKKLFLEDGRIPKRVLEDREKALKEEADDIRNTFTSYVEDKFDIDEDDYAGQGYERGYSDYREIYDRAFERTGSAEASHQMAVMAINKTWGITRAEGRPRLTRNPIERMAGYEGALLQADVEEQVALLGVEGQYVLREDTDTTRSKNGPSWLVMKVDDYGLVELVLDEEGRPARFHPDAKRAEGALARKIMVQRRAAAREEVLAENARRYEFDEFGSRVQGAVEALPEDEISRLVDEQIAKEDADEREALERKNEYNKTIRGWRANPNKYDNVPNLRFGN